MSMQPYVIAGSDVGLELDKKSFLLPDKAFTVLYNAYVWRERVKKREGLKIMGRFRRVLTGQSLGNTAAGDTTTISDILTSFRATEPNSEVEPGSVVITIIGADAATYTDQGDGTFVVTGKGDATGSYINYVTGDIVLKFNPIAVGGVAISADFNYFPTLPCMGIIQRERANINNEQTLFWDQKYCYTYDGTNFSEYLPLTSKTWNGSNSEFFWGTNFQASDPATRNLYVTNFNLDATGNPIRYTNGSVWTDFEPSISSTQVNNESLGTYIAGTGVFGPAVTANTNIVPGTVTITVSNGTDPDTIFTDPSRNGTLQGSPNTSSGTINYSTGSISLTINPTMPAANSSVIITYKYEANKLYSSRILIPYYGRLLALNTFEGTSRATSVQYFNRCRFSQIGDPTQSGAWDSTIFGRGGYIDAPTNEEIISAVFYKNTLIIFFERSTWNLRYVGEYGLPFIFERISSDFGSESQFSSVLFDEAVIAVGNRAIIQANTQSTGRIDNNIPDIVFGFRNQNEGTARVHGIRDYYKEIVYWCYNDSTETGTAQIYPNKFLIYNYKNGSWAIFRTNATAFGYYESDNSITWSRYDVYWDDYTVTWNDPDGQAEFPFTVCGNQQGYCHILGEQTNDDNSLSISDIDRTLTPPRITVKNHNFIDGDIIYIDGLDFIDTSNSSDVTTDLNDNTYQINTLTPYDADVVEISKWDTSSQSYIDNFTYTPTAGTGTYIGSGKVTLLPRMKIVTKDFNPFLVKGKQIKLSYVDFLTDETTNGVVNVKIFSGTSTKEESNLIVGQKNFITTASPIFPNDVTNMHFNRFFSTVFGNFINLQISYDDDQMNDMTVYDQPFILNALILWLREGGRIAN